MSDSSYSIIKEIHEVLETHQPFTNWKAVSRALNEIIDIVEWIRPDERNSTLTITKDEK